MAGWFSRRRSAKIWNSARVTSSDASNSARNATILERFSFSPVCSVVATLLARPTNASSATLLSQWATTSAVPIERVRPATATANVRRRPVPRSRPGAAGGSVARPSAALKPLSLISFEICARIPCNWAGQHARYNPQAQGAPSQLAIIVAKSVTSASVARGIRIGLRVPSGFGSEAVTTRVVSSLPAGRSPVPPWFGLQQSRATAPCRDSGSPSDRACA